MKTNSSVRDRLYYLAVCLALVMACCMPLNAQITTGSIFGRVVDQTQAVVPGASVKAISLDTGRERSAATDMGGNYEFPLLPVGKYRLEVEKPGFGPKVVADIVLHVSQKVEVAVTLEPGTVREVVEVQAEAALLKPGTSDIGEIIQHERVVQLPLNGREFMQLTLLTGGVTDSVNQSSINLFQQAGPIVSVNGQRENQNSFRFDGIQTYAPFYGNLPVTPPIDGVEEFKVQTALYTADSGQFPGAQINVITKSGNNLLHGSVYSFYRSHIFDARNFFDRGDQPIPRFNRNQFGSSAGGPIRKDETFWFVSYEGLRDRKSISRLNTVPLVQQRCGANVDQDCDLSAFGTITDPRTGQPFPGGIIPNSRIDPVSRIVLKRFMPLPNLPGTTGNFFSSPIRPTTTDAVLARMDQSLSQKDQINGRFMWQRLSTLDPFGGPAPVLGGLPTLPGFGVFSNTRTTQVTIAETHIFSGSTVNEFRVGYTHFSYGFLQQNFEEDFNGQNGIQGTNPIPIQHGIPMFVTAQYGTIGDAAFTNFSIGQSVSVLDNFSITRGSHTFKLGFEMQRNQDNPVTQFGPRGIFSFAGRFTGNRLGDFVLGIPSTTLVNSDGDSKSHGRNTNIFLYAQDDWRVTPRFTLNLGLRWEYAGRYTDRRCRDSAYDPDFPGGRLVLADHCGHIGFPVVQAEMDRFRSLGRLALASEVGWPDTLVDRYYRRFAPRVGFSWQPFSKTVVRSAYGIFWNQATSNEDGISMESTPWAAVRSFGNFDPNITTRTVSLSGLLATVPGARLARGFKPGYVQQWGFNLQQNLTSNLLVEGSYVGSFGQRLGIAWGMNDARPGPGPIQPRRPNPIFGGIGGLGSNMGKSWYHGFIGRVEKRFSQGLQFNASLTISKCLDLGSSSFNQSDEHFNPMNAYDLQNSEKGPCIFDARRRFVTSPMYELPFGKGKKFLGGASGLAGKLVSGWMITSILTLRGSLPFTVVLQEDVTNRASANAPDRPNVICDPNEFSNRSTARWFDTSCFVRQADFTFGNAGRNINRGPSLRNLDFSVIKKTELSEMTALEFRAEFFNLPNHPHWGTPVRVKESLDFGKILKTVSDSRQIQFAMKFLF